MTEAKSIKFSIITVCFNSDKSIYDTLQSVNSQTWQNLEHIIIDGGSKDKTIEIIKLHGNRVSKIISEKDDGIYDAMNKGIEIATGDVIGFLNSDDFFCNDEIINQYATYFSQNPHTEAVYGDISYIQNDIKEGIKILRNWKAHSFSKGSFSRGWIPPHPSFYARREVFEKYGHFRKDFYFAADFDLMCRFITKGVCTKYIPGEKIYMRVGGATNQSWINILKGNIEIIKSLNKNGIEIGIKFFFFKFLNRISQYF